jgi:hypothetical protein
VVQGLQIGGISSDPARSFWTRFLTELAGPPIVIGQAAFTARTKKPELEIFTFVSAAVLLDVEIAAPRAEH